MDVVILNWPLKCWRWPRIGSPMGAGTDEPCPPLRSPWLKDSLSFVDQTKYVVCRMFPQPYSLMFPNWPLQGVKIYICSMIFMFSNQLPVVVAYGLPSFQVVLTRPLWWGRLWGACSRCLFLVPSAVWKVIESGVSGWQFLSPPPGKEDRAGAFVPMQEFWSKSS